LCGLAISLVILVSLTVVAPSAIVGAYADEAPATVNS
jgi:hypothetical protein